MFKKNIPFYKATFNEKDPSMGVYAIALVDRPAIEEKWITFKENEKLFKLQSEEKRIISGVLLIPDFPVYRNDKDLGEHYIVFDKETIFKTALSFFKLSQTTNINQMHDNNYKANDVFVFESMIIDKERGNEGNKLLGELSDGSWYVSLKVDNDNIWNDFIKTGIFTGLSIEGFFNYVLHSTELREVEKLINEISEITEIK